MPYDLVGAVAQEIVFAEQPPDLLDAFVGDARLVQGLQGFLLLLEDELLAIDRILEAAAQGAMREFVQVVEQRGLPGIPELGIRSAHVGDRQHVQVIEVQRIAHQGCEFVDHVRIADVFLLRRRRQDQVIADEPGDDPCIVIAHPVFEAERLGIDGAELGVIPAAALRDVVEQPGQVRDLGLLERLHDMAAVRELVIEARQGEAAQVAHDEQGVFVDRVGVEEIVLHAADDAAETRDVQAQHAVQVHSPEFVRHAFRRTQDRQEQAMIARILPEFLVDQVQVALDESHRVGTDALDLRMLLQQQEQFQQGRGIVREYAFVHGLQVTVLDLEARIQRRRGRIGIHQDRFFEELQQHFVEPAELHDGAIVALHQLFDGQRVGRVLVAEHLGQLDLVIEEDAVLAAPGENVQRESDPPQEGLTFVQAAHLALRQEAVRDEFIEGLDAEMALCNPTDHLDVAQAPGAALDVGFEVVRGVAVAVMTGDLFLAFLREELPGGPDIVGGNCGLHRIVELRGPVQQPRLHQRGRDGQVGARLFAALRDRTHAVTNLEADVPERGNERGEPPLAGLGQSVRQQQQDVDVRGRMQFGAAVAADGDQRHLVGMLAGVPAPQLQQ